MSTIVPPQLEEGDDYSASSLNDAFGNLSAGYNALADDDLRAESFDVGAAHPAAIESLMSNVVRSNANLATPFTTTFAYPGHGLALSTWPQVVLGGVSVVSCVAAGGGFEVGPNSPQLIGGVLVGFSCEVTMSAGLGHLALAVEHTGSTPALDVIPATDFTTNAPAGNAARFASFEYIITDADVPAGESLLSVRLVAASNGVATLTVDKYMIFAIPLHSEG
jgi:hypothetical protein